MCVVILTLIFITTLVRISEPIINTKITLPIRLCSEDFCDLFECVPLEDCAEDEIIEKKASVCGCCDSCVKILKENEICENIEIPFNGKPVVKCENECKCMRPEIPEDEKPDDDEEEDATKKIPTIHDRTKRCLKSKHDDHGKDLPKCIKERLKRQEKMSDPDQASSELKLDQDLWFPECDENGFYKPKQCKNRKCFCISPYGDRLFGQAEHDLSQNMTCLCSLAMYHKEMKEGLKWRTGYREHCTKDGNFAELQCVDDICFCVDEFLGEARGRAVKSTQKEFLFCYKSEDFEDREYLSSCEKQLIGVRGMIYEFFLKGIKIIYQENVFCDLDGKFNSKQCDRSGCRCTDDKGLSLKSYAVDGSHSKSSMNCRCAFDELQIERHAAQYSRMTCGGNGNFHFYQDFIEDRFCVDEDGDKITETIVKLDQLESDCNLLANNLTIT